MDISNREQSLVALLLALSDVSDAIATETTTTLTTVAEQLAANPAAWDAYIAPNLESAIAQNSDLKAHFLKYQSELAQLPQNEIVEFLPKAAELEAVMPSPTAFVERGFAPGMADAPTASEEINNIAVRVLTSPEPVANTQKLGALAQLKAKIKKSVG